MNNVGVEKTESLKRYKVIYADPTWNYKDKARAGKRGVEYKYNCMSMAKIRTLPVYEMADKDAFLFLWATMPLLQEALDLINIWGFKYKTCGFPWLKLNKRNRDTLFWGGGNYTRSNMELCLLGTKGKPKRVSKSVHSVIESQIREHSRKPDETRDKIVQLAGDVNRIELFARQVTEGWDVWGDHKDVVSSKNFVDIGRYWSLV